MADLETYIVKLLRFHFKSDAQKFEYRLLTAAKNIQRSFQMIELKVFTIMGKLLLN